MCVCIIHSSPPVLRHIIPRRQVAAALQSNLRTVETETLSVIQVSTYSLSTSTTSASAANSPLRTTLSTHLLEQRALQIARRRAGDRAQDAVEKLAAFELRRRSSHDGCAEHGHDGGEGEIESHRDECGRSLAGVDAMLFGIQRTAIRIFHRSLRSSRDVTHHLRVL